jgi:tRNA 2-thiouridine synthesizing protein A
MSESSTDSSTESSTDSSSSWSGTAIEVDARGLRCPIPVIRLGATIRDLAPGAVVRLLATDPAAGSDVAAFCRMRGHDLLQVIDVTPEGERGYQEYLIRR